jgi:hypothetical protein
MKDETEIRLRAERDLLQQQLREKQQEYDDYRNLNNKRACDEMRLKYSGKIIRVKQYWHGLAPMNKVALLYRYYFVFVEDVKYRWENSSEFSGRVLEMDLDPDGFDTANHLVDREFEKVNFSSYQSSQIRVDDDEIERVYTADEVRDIANRVREAQDEILDAFLNGRKKKRKGK